MEELAADAPRGRISGTFDGRFAAVAQEFVRNFAERGETGASLCLTVGGETVVDLWGGVVSRDDHPWERDTISVIFSCTKGLVAICAHVLASRGLLDLEAPVAEYWPEFGANDKDRVTVRMLLDHSAAVPALREPVPAGAALDWDYMVERIAAEAPFWEPGTRNGYHMTMFGWTVGEVVRRVSGQSLGAFFRTAVADPLEADAWIGLPESEEPRVAPIIGYARRPEDTPTVFEASVAQQGSISQLAFLNRGELGTNSREMHAAELGGGGGITNGRGLARIYAPLANGGALAGVRLVDAVTLARMGEVSMATHDDATLRIPTRFAPGFMKSMDNRRQTPGNQDSVILSSTAFGHVGAGGSIGFADPARGLSFGYTMNRMGRSLLLNERGQSLIDTTYRALGGTTNEGGAWM